MEEGEREERERGKEKLSEGHGDRWLQGQQRSTRCW